MNIAFILGNLIGRAITSYMMVWVICFLSSRFNTKLAYQRSLRWYSWVGIVVLTVIGLGGAILKHGGLN
jgi:hypothetical protein